jgi:hypothetical protein
VTSLFPPYLPISGLRSRLSAGRDELMRFSTPWLHIDKASPAEKIPSSGPSTTLPIFSSRTRRGSARVLSNELRLIKVPTTWVQLNDMHGPCYLQLYGLFWCGISRLLVATFECGVISGEGAGMMPSSSPLCPGMISGNKYPKCANAHRHGILKREIRRNVAERYHFLAHAW